MAPKRIKTPVFCRTIRFRLTVFNTLFLIFLMMVLVGGINIAVWRFRTELPPTSPQSVAEMRAWTDAHRLELSRVVDNYRLFSEIGVIVIIFIGAVGGYFLSRFMLKPVDRVSLLASRISYSNLRERLNYSGPNDEVKRLADTFDDMLSRLETAVESQKQFIQDASHELRTPIATAITNIEVLEMNEKATIADYQKLMGILKLSLERMNNISNSLQLLSEDAVSCSKWSRVDIPSLIFEVVNESAAEASACNVSLKWLVPEESLTVKGDASSLKRAFFNLVNNAIKYNRSGGLVTVMAYSTENRLIIEVADTGIGIDGNDLPKVFDRFYRVDKSRSRERGGSGLGLSIVRKIVLEHGGEVTAESTPGQGSTFKVSLPL
ncbi:MAG: HAMP domain-containing histidine kinase [Dehalococcoidales bacterium]|nr:HAMP domain-containing histidine kinase [Dehalococcoidales bacterium]